MTVNNIFDSGIRLIFVSDLLDFCKKYRKDDSLMSVYKFEGKIPKISKTSYLHPRSVIIGDVEIGEGCFIGAGAVLRGDFGKIVVGSRTSIQENCVIHVGEGKTSSIDSDVIIAHGAILHDVTVKSYVMVGMGSILMNGVFCENHVLIGAGSVVKENFCIPSNVVVAGNPARIVGPLLDEQRRRIHQGVKIYAQLVKRYKKLKLHPL